MQLTKAVAVWATLGLLMGGRVGGTKGLATPPPTWVVADLEEGTPLPRAYPWPTDEDGSPATAKVRAERSRAEVKQGRYALKVEYEFPSEKCTQVMVDAGVLAGGCYRRIRFWVYGDGSGNRLETWLAGAGGWFGQGRLPLDFTGWREVTFPVTQIDTDVVTTLRFCIVETGGLGAHTLYFDDLRLENPTAPRLTDLRVFPRVPPKLLRVEPVEKEFRVERRRMADRTVLLLDGEPLFCVLDVRFERAYLEMAREVGVNCFALDFYWRNLEPRPGYREWERLRTALECLRRWGFGVILLFGPHQPNWWRLQHAAEPGAKEGRVYLFTPSLKRDFGALVAELVRQTCEFPNLIGYMISAGGEQDSCFPEVLGNPGPGSVWRQSPWCLRDFRAFLRRKYRGEVAALQKAWGEEGLTFEEAVPPRRLERDDYRRSWLDWAEFANGWWVQFVEWAGGIVKGIAPHKLFQARFGWPVFQAENIFLCRQAKHLDLLQCKDAVAPWEVGHPGYQLSRTALYFGACRHSDKVVFPEMDIIHGRGYQPGDLSRYFPLFADKAGALWYYRGLKPDDKAFWADFKRAVALAKQMLQRDYPPAIVGIFYSLAYANWISRHRNYLNENSLVGCAELLQDLGVRYAVVSEFNLTDLADYAVVIVPYNPAISETAVRALENYLTQGGALIIEPEVGVYDYEVGQRRREAGTLPFAKVRVLIENEGPRRMKVRWRGWGRENRTLTCFAHVKQYIRADGTIVGTFENGAPAIVLGDERSRTLYLAFRFFLPYSFSDDAAAKEQKRELIRAFLDWCGVGG